MLEPTWASEQQSLLRLVVVLLRLNLIAVRSRNSNQGFVFHAM
jgi:hypothetical protein